MKFYFTKSFQKEIKKFSQNKKNLKPLINTVIKDFSINLLKSKYYRKKLAWFKLLHELEVGWDYRIIIKIIIKEDSCYFLHFWIHSYLDKKW